MQLFLFVETIPQDSADRSRASVKVIVSGMMSTRVILDKSFHYFFGPFGQKKRDARACACKSVQEFVLGLFLPALQSPLFFIDITMAFLWTETVDITPIHRFSPLPKGLLALSFSSFTRMCLSFTHS